jgi:hypothetical protein
MSRLVMGLLYIYSEVLANLTCGKPQYPVSQDSSVIKMSAEMMKASKPTIFNYLPDTWHSQTT